MPKVRATPQAPAVTRQPRPIVMLFTLCVTSSSRSCSR
nr:MAG TPA: hypothetical protein [Caudoviricetes sp.]